MICDLFLIKQLAIHWIQNIAVKLTLFINSFICVNNIHINSEV